MKVKPISSAPSDGEFLAERGGDWLRAKRTGSIEREIFGDNAVETTAGRKSLIFVPKFWMEIPDELCEVSDG